MDLLLVVARLLLAAVFATAGTTKLRDRAGFQHTLQEFGLPHAPLAIAGIAIPIVELVIAVALLVREPRGGVPPAPLRCFCSSALLSLTT